MKKREKMLKNDSLFRRWSDTLRERLRRTGSPPPWPRPLRKHDSHHGTSTHTYSKTYPQCTSNFRIQILKSEAPPQHHVATPPHYQPVATPYHVKLHLLTKAPMVSIPPLTPLTHSAHSSLAHCHWLTPQSPAPSCLPGRPDGRKLTGTTTFCKIM